VTEPPAETEPSHLTWHGVVICGGEPQGRTVRFAAYQDERQRRTARRGVCAECAFLEAGVTRWLKAPPSVTVDRVVAAFQEAVSDGTIRELAVKAWDTAEAVQGRADGLDRDGGR
jgi:hypothetical protein